MKYLLMLFAILFCNDKPKQVKEYDLVVEVQCGTGLTIYAKVHWDKQQFETIRWDRGKNIRDTLITNNKGEIVYKSIKD